MRLAKLNGICRFSVFQGVKGVATNFRVSGDGVMDSKLPILKFEFLLGFRPLNFENVPNKFFFFWKM